MKWTTLAVAAGVMIGCQPRQDPVEADEVSAAAPVQADDAIWTEGGVHFVNGRLIATLRAPLSDVVLAARRALNSMHMLHAQGTIHGLEGVVTAAMPGGEKVLINISQRGEAIRVGILPGTTGNEGLAREIYQRMAANLPADAVQQQ